MPKAPSCESACSKWKRGENKRGCEQAVGLRRDGSHFGLRSTSCLLWGSAGFGHGFHMGLGEVGVQRDLAGEPTQLEHRGDELEVMLVAGEGGVWDGCYLAIGALWPSANET